MLILARGRFEQPRLEALALEHGGKVEDYQGKRLLTHANDSGEPDMAVGFLEADLIAFGSYTAIKKAIDASSRQQHRVQHRDDASDQRARQQQRLGRRPLRRDCQRRPPSRRNSARSSPPSSGSRPPATSTAASAASSRPKPATTSRAKNLRDVLSGFLALAKMQAGSKPELKTMVDSLQLSGDGKNVALSFTVPTELFDALEAMAKQHAQ